MQNKKILIIGAGLAQADGIQRARELGYYVLASDGDASAPGLSMAHESRVIDVKNIEENLRWAKEAQVNGVISFASDITLPAVQGVRSELGLPGLGMVPMALSLDKAKQREKFKAAGLPQPEFEVVSTRNELEKAAKHLGFPLVVKPVDNSGSRGVTIVEEESLLPKAYEEAKENSRSGLLIVEQFMEGKDLTVDGLSIEGEHHIFAISEKYKPRHKYPVARYLVFPAPISDREEKKVIDLLKAAYDVAGIDNTPTHAELILTPQGPKIIEIACRGGGFFVFTRIAFAVSGYDILSNWIRMCVADPVEQPGFRLRKGAVLKFYDAPSGRFLGVSGLEQARSMPRVQTELFIKPGEMIPELRNGGQRVGWMIALGEDRDEAVRTADEVLNLIKFQVEGS